MSMTFTYYSVSEDQVKAMLAGLGANAVHDFDVTIGTPFGDISGTYNYVLSSGQLTIVVEHKPFIVSHNMIDEHIRVSLAAAAPLPIESSVTADATALLRLGHTDDSNHPVAEIHDPVVQPHDGPHVVTVEPVSFPCQTEFEKTDEHGH